MNREDELAVLIREQKRDDRQFQAPERGVVPLGLLGDYVDVEALGRRPRAKGGVFASEECPIHGLSFMKVYPSDRTRARCTRCILDQQTMRRETDEAYAAAKRAKVNAHEKKHRKEDPDYAERRRESNRRWRERQKGR